jgi:myo-inositol-1(or 4)-monophosphatase
MQEPLDNICLKAREVVRAAGNFILQERSGFNIQAVELKGLNDLVSYVDKTAESILVKGLADILPGCGFITEENTAGNTGEAYQWIIDPLDGTTNFVHGVPCFCVSVALQHHSKLVMGIVYELNLDEMFYSWEGAPAYLNGNVIRVSGTSAAAASLVATGFPYTNFSKMKEYMQVFDWCMRNTHGLRRLGSAAVDLVYVACGRFDAFYEYGLNSWDVAGGAFIVQQAGGKVTDFSGKDDFVFGKEILATNEKTHQEFLAMIKSEFSG